MSVKTLYTYSSTGEREDINLSATSVKFSDDESFQDKLNAGSLKGDTGATGPQGPAGSDATVTKTNVISALGYTPSNSGLTQAEVEELIANNKNDEIGITKLPLYNKYSSQRPAWTNEEGVFAFGFKTNSSGNTTDDLPDGNIINNWSVNDIDGNVLKNKLYAAGICVNTDAPYSGFCLASHASGGGLWVRFKGKSNYKQLGADNDDSSTGWNNIIDRFGICGMSQSVACIGFLDNLTAADMSGWHISSGADWKYFPYGLSSCVAKVDDTVYFVITFKYGSDNEHAHRKYPAYQSQYKGYGLQLFLPWSSNGAGIILISYNNNGNPTGWCGTSLSSFSSL